jgi:hypothetical protein
MRNTETDYEHNMNEAEFKQLRSDTELDKFTLAPGSVTTTMYKRKRERDGTFA